MVELLYAIYNSNWRIDWPRISSLTAEKKKHFWKKKSFTRRNGITPVHVYGLKSDSLSLQANEKDLISVLKSAGRTTPVSIKTKDGEETITIVREVDRHAVSGNIQHVDFLRVDINEEVESPVPVILINQDKAPGTAGGAGVVTQGTFEITVRAKPFDMPSELEADCSVLVDLDAAILSNDIILGDGVSLSSSSDDRIAWIQPQELSLMNLQFLRKVLLKKGMNLQKILLNLTNSKQALLKNHSQKIN